MEALLIAAAIIFAGWVATKPKAAPAPTPSPADPGSSSGVGSSLPPAPVAKPPGAYPPGTPGTFPIQVQVMGGCNELGSRNGSLTATPGGKTTGSSMFWYAPGTKVTFQAQTEGGWSPFIAFDHFEGPGVTSKQNPFQATISGPGYVRAVFACLGVSGL